MTISTTNSIAVLNGNDATTSFPVGVKFLKNSDMVVTLSDNNGTVTQLVEGTGDGEYSLTGAGDDAGGTLVYPEGEGTTLPTGWTITVTRELALVQDLDLTNQSGLFLEVIESMFDRVVMMMQQVYDQESFAALRKDITNVFFDAFGDRISNIGKPIAATDAVRLTELSDLEARVLADSEVAFTSWQMVGTGTTDYEIAGATTSEEGAYDVLLDNVRQRPELDYTINIGANPPQINFTSVVNDPVDIYILARGYNSQVVGASAGSWNDLTDKPTEFTPVAHSHDYSLTYAAKSHTHAAGDLPSASISGKGVVQLTSSTDSESTELAATASAVKAVKALIGSGGVVDGTTSVKGIVQLENSIASNSITKAATPASVKSAYDAAVAAQSTADGKASSGHDHNSQYAPKISVTSSTSTSAPSNSGRSDGDEHYIY